MSWIYSCRSDSIGSILAARYAGYRPKVIPTVALIPKANTNELLVITVGIRPKWVTRNGIREPRMIPRIPPASVKSSTSPEAQPTDGWGSSAMLYALVEGLAGVVDRAAGLQRVRLSPRWLAAGVSSAEVRVGYAASGARFAYSFACEADRIRIRVESGGAEVAFHVLLPEETEAGQVTVDGEVVSHQDVRIRESRYVDFSARVNKGASVEIGFAD